MHPATHPATHAAMHPASAQLLARQQWVQRSPEWFAIRQELLTASDAASALGIKPYASYRGDIRSELLRKKVSNAPIDNMFVTHGQKYEDEARQWACEAMGETAEDVGLVRHRDLPWLGASPDGVTHSGKLIEIKCPLKRAIQPGVVPHHYWPQVQCQMEVCDVDQTIFVQYKPAAFTAGSRAFIDVVVVERDREWFRRHQDQLHAFWKDYMRARDESRARPDKGASGDIPPAKQARVQCLIDEAMYSDM